MKKILNLVLVLMLAVLIVGCGKKEETKDSNDEIIGEYKSNDLVFKNESIAKSGDNTIITSSLTNNSKSEKTIGWVKLIVTYKNATDNETTTEILVYFGDRIEGKQTLQTTTIVDFDIDSITKVEYEFSKK